MRLSSSVLSPLGATVVAAQNATVSSSMPQVTLDYCTVQAAAANLSAGIYKYQNVRFAAPQWPPVETEVNDGTLAASNVACTSAEDCLFMDIYVPANATGKKLPVLQWTYGAGANKSHTTPEGLYDLSKDFIFVTYNYRDGIVGVANGPTFTHEGGATNAAVRDTEQAYKWTRKYISAFGGDPDNIVALAFSAGSSQTLDQITRYGGNAEQLFARAYLTSPGTVPGSGHQQAEAFWQNVSATVGCSGGGLDCMRAVNYTTLNTAVTEVISLYSYTLQPRVDGDIISDTYEAEFYAGHYNWTGPLVITHELHEKNSDVTSGINSTADVADKIRMYFPGITDTVINQILALHPESDYASPGLRFSDIEQSFELTSHNLALTNGLHNQTWNAMVALGEATHGTDQDYYWYSTYALSGDIQTSPVNATTARIMQKYLLSFALTSNPNTLWPNDKMEWPLYNTSTNGVEIVYNTSMYLQADSLAKAKSRFWNKALWY
ncbi:uncharacterized protein EAE97_008747 [Botrytis byssoidea]|uniref:Carboxylesterase type B domain-containing protein n=1 Tax=Botrytis byssoidea TaxID=139641 RepID=A0A9P5I5R9_9HELO|nr:uncharacterized protein EAE97_008747 [Botrytis byssoidea]KAF7932980.1 hypothetical protein EAE97_008747 [Botrytis byssoidea]